MTDMCMAPTDVDMLIDPSKFPCRSADFDAEQIRGSADLLDAMGSGVQEQMTGISTTWTQLEAPATYRGPEQQQVYDLMDPAVTSADGLAEVLADAATLLRTYAGALEDVQTRLSTLEEEATTFRADVIDGVTIDKAASNEAGFGDYAAWAFDWVPGVDQEQVTVPWNQDGDSVARNTELLEEHAAILADISTAATTCSNGLKALITGVCVPQDVALPAEAFLDPSVPMPWGSPVTEDRNCPESVGHGVANFGVGLWEGGATILGFDVENGYSWSLGGLGEGLWGVVNVVGSLAITVVTAPAVVWYTDNKDENALAGWLYDRAVTGTTAAGSLIGFDMTAALNGENGWHAWEDDAWAAGTESVLNVGTFFIPVGAVARGGSAAARAARLVTGAAEFIIPGASWLLRGGVRVVDDLTRIVDDVPVPRTGPLGGNPWANLVDAVDDVPPHTPISDAVFPRPGELPDVPTTGPGSVGGRDVPDVPTVHGPDGAAPGTPDGPNATPEGGAPGAPDPVAEAEARTAHPEPRPDIEIDRTDARDDAVQAREDVVADRAEAVAARAEALQTLDDLGVSIDPGDLTVRKIDSVLDQAVDDVMSSDLDAAQKGAVLDALDDLRDAAWSERSSYTDLNAASETLGDTGATDFLASRGDEVVVDAAGAGSGQFDGVGYHPADRVLDVVEAKGAGARLSTSGRLLSDGTRAAQGSTLYFNDVFAHDPRIAELLQQRPDIAQGLADGTIEVRYTLVHTLADGTVRVSELPLDPAYLDLGLS